ncbi:MAG TPA: hypothetical protein VGS62_06345 [Streptosporangiaceae bacterium]|nr:hypothetical protein [Streptosporangiaceae bacterium]
MTVNPRTSTLALLATGALLLPAQAASASHRTLPARPALAEAGSGTVTVSLTGPARPVTPAMMGLSGVDTSGPLWNDPAFDAVLQKFSPGVLRYPGGTAANYWSWQTGWFQPGRWPSEPPVPVDDKLPVFGAGFRAAGAVPSYVLNLLTNQGVVATDADNTAMLAGQLRFLDAAAARGWPVSMVELGNEVDLSGVRSTGPHAGEYARRFPTAAGYATQVNPWIAAIHRAFPGAQVAAVATDANDIPGIAPRRTGWNAAVLPRLRGEDAVTIHENLRVYNATWTPSQLLAFPYLHLQKLKADELPLFASYRLPVWITAFGLEDLTQGQVFGGTWLSGLFDAEQALRFLGVPIVKHLQFYSSVGNYKAAIFANDKGFGAAGPSTVPLSLTAGGTALAMIEPACRRASAASPLAFAPDPPLGQTGAPALAGTGLSTPGGPELLLENLSSRAITVSLAGIFPAAVTTTQITAPSPTTLVTGPGSTTTSTTTRSNGLVQLAPYSLSDISSSQAEVPPRLIG